MRFLLTSGDLQAQSRSSDALWATVMSKLKKLGIKPPPRKDVEALKLPKVTGDIHDANKDRGRWRSQTYSSFAEALIKDNPMLKPSKDIVDEAFRVSAARLPLNDIPKRSAVQQMIARVRRLKLRVEYSTAY